MTFEEINADRLRALHSEINQLSPKKDDVTSQLQLIWNHCEILCLGNQSHEGQAGFVSGVRAVQSRVHQLIGDSKIP